MRIIRWTLATLLFLALVLFVFVPPIIGLFFEKIVNIRMSLLGLQNKAEVQVINYKKGWFSSDVVTRIKLTDSEIPLLLTSFGLNRDEAMSLTEFVFSQHVQHGPIFYHHKKLPKWYGVVAIDRKWLIDGKQKPLLEKLNIRDSLLQVDQTIVSFSGKYLTKVDLGKYAVTINGLQLGFDSFLSQIQLSSSRQMEGHFLLSQLFLSDGVASLSIPGVAVDFNLHKNLNDLWMGSQSLALSEVVAKESDNLLLTMNDVQFSMLTSDESGLIDITKNISMKKLRADNQEYGPFNLQVSIDDLNAQAIKDLIDSYREIKQHGELYESQLNQKIRMLVPKIMNPNTNFRVDTLTLVTPNGKLQFDGKVDWPRDNVNHNDSLSDLVKDANLKLNLRVSVPLANQIVTLASKLIYVYQIPPSERFKLMDLQDDIRFVTQQNNVVISELAAQGVLTKEDGLQLIQYVRQNAGYDEFAKKIRELFLTRELSREGTYWLLSNYFELYKMSQQFENELRRYQQLVEKQLQDQVTRFVKEGFIVEDKNTYLINMQRENGLTKLGEKELN